MEQINKYYIFFRPDCKGIVFAINEIKEFLENNKNKAKFEYIIGHGKGGLVSSLLKGEAEITASISTPFDGTKTVMPNPVKCPIKNYFHGEALDLYNVDFDIIPESNLLKKGMKLSKDDIKDEIVDIKLKFLCLEEQEKKLVDNKIFDTIKAVNIKREKQVLKNRLESLREVLNKESYKKIETNKSSKFKKHNWNIDVNVVAKTKKCSFMGIVDKLYDVKGDGAVSYKSQITNVNADKTIMLLASHDKSLNKGLKEMYNRGIIE